MKTLKFKRHLVSKVLNGSKTITWRLFDDKNLQKDDELDFIDAENGEKFAEAKIIDIKEKRIRDLTEDDFKNNDYQNKEEVISLNRKYYGDSVSDDTFVKIIKFEIKK